MDRNETFIYNKNIRVRRTFLGKVIDEISDIRKFDPTERELFTFSAMLAAALASEIKDDEGSVFVSLKAPVGGKVATAFCETDGRLRGYADMKPADPLTDGRYLLTVGIRLYVRGDYQSTVTADTPENAALAYFLNSAQTKATVKINYGQESAMYLCEYLPGHDVNTTDQVKAELKDKKGMLEKALEEAIKDPATVEEMEAQAVTHIVYGCSCTKRKLRAIFESQGIQIGDGMEAECRLCGKIYRF